MRTTPRKGRLLMINETALTVDGTAITITIQTRTDREIVFIDKEDWIVVEQIQRWILYKDPKGRKFARADKKDDQILLHRLLFDMPKDYKLHWISGNTLDCRRENLQLVDRQGMKAPDAVQRLVLYGNAHKEPEKPTSAVPGVKWHKHSKSWEVRIYHEGKRYSLGYFKDHVEAEQEALVFREEGPDSPNLKRNQRKGK